MVMKLKWTMSIYNKQGKLVVVLDHLHSADIRLLPSFWDFGHFVVGVASDISTESCCYGNLFLISEVGGMGGTEVFVYTITITGEMIYHHGASLIV